MIIALVATRNLYYNMRVLIHSIKKHNPDAELWCFIEDDYLDGIDANFINMSNKIDFISKDSPNYSNQWTKFVFVRLKFHELIPYDKVIYLDIDTLILKPLDELWNIDIEDYYVAGVHDTGAEETGHIDKGETYINAGVMLMNLKKIREDKLDIKWFDELNKNYYAYPDQDVINFFSDEKIKEIDNKYGAGPSTGYSNDNVILHYTYKKGWDYRSPLSEYWFDAEQEMLQEGEVQLVVVGIPVYHSRETLPRALDSLVLQTKKMFMVMIVNDADGEDYSDIIEDYKKRGLKITYVVQDENGGPGKCRQRVIDSCPMCEYIMFLDSDDMYSPITVESLTRAIQQKNLDVVMGNSTQMRRGKPAYRADVNSTSITWVWNKIYRRQYLIDNNIRFPDDLRVSEDIAFSLPVWNGTEKKLRIEQDIYYWCDNKNSLTRIEGKTEFDKKNIADFIKAQVYGLEKIEEMGVEISPRLFAPTLKIIYTQISTANALGATEDGYIDVLKRLNNLMAMGYFENDFESWEYIVNNCPAGIVTDSNDVVFFKERFVDWYKRVFSD